MMTVKIASLLLVVWASYVATAAYHRPMVRQIQHQMKLDPLNSYARPAPAWV